MDSLMMFMFLSTGGVFSLTFGVLIVMHLYK